MFKSNHLTEFQKSNYNNLSPTEKQTLHFELFQVATFCHSKRLIFLNNLSPHKIYTCCNASVIAVSLISEVHKSQY